MLRKADLVQISERRGGGKVKGPSAVLSATDGGILPADGKIVEFSVDFKKEEGCVRSLRLTWWKREWIYTICHIQQA